MRVETASCSVSMTSDHEVFTTNRGFVRADALRYSDELLVLLEISPWRALALKLYSIVGRFIDVIRKPAESLTADTSGVRNEIGKLRFSYIGACMKIIMDLFPRATTSIMSMATKEIISPRILSPSPPSGSTYTSITLPHGSNDSGSFSTRFDRSVRLGMRARKGAPFIENSGEWPTKRSIRQRSIARTVAHDFFLEHWAI